MLKTGKFGILSPIAVLIAGAILLPMCDYREWNKRTQSTPPAHKTDVQVGGDNSTR